VTEAVGNLRPIYRYIFTVVLYALRGLASACVSVCVFVCVCVCLLACIRIGDGSSLPVHHGRKSGEGLSGMLTCMMEDK